MSDVLTARANAHSGKGPMMMFFGGAPAASNGCRYEARYYE